MKKVILTLILALALALAIYGSAAAIVYGELDGNGHPYVVAIVRHGEGDVPVGRCTGTLLSPTLILTAGHCTVDFPNLPHVTHIEVWPVDDPHMEHYDFVRANSSYLDATNFYPYPGYQWGFGANDVGVVELAEPINLAEYGELPQAYQLDELFAQRNLPDITFTMVGYGYQAEYPDPAAWKNETYPIRMVAHPRLIQMYQPFLGVNRLLTSSNANTGGGCFFDSGAPLFIDDSRVIAGVDNGGNPNCKGQNIVRRIDLPETLAWLDSIMNPQQ